MIDRRAFARLFGAGFALLLLGACATDGGVPVAVADADPIPSCPPSICPQHTPTQPPPPSDEPSPEPTASQPGRTTTPKPKQSMPGSVAPGGGKPTPGATTSAGPLPSVAPSNTRFAAFPFSSLPYDQAFPRDPPPPPAPLSLPPPTAMVALAALLAAGVAAATSITARRRAWTRMDTAMPTGGTA